MGPGAGRAGVGHDLVMDQHSHTDSQVDAEGATDSALTDAAG